MVEYTLPSKSRDQLLYDIARDLNSEGYDMYYTQDMITGVYNFIISKGYKSVGRAIDNWYYYEPEVYIKMVIKEMISEVDKLIKQEKE